jgi:hypothetical protein
MLVGRICAGKLWPVRRRGPRTHRRGSGPGVPPWIRADERLPHDGAGIIAAVTGRYPGEPEDDPDSSRGVAEVLGRRHLSFVTTGNWSIKE